MALHRLPDNISQGEYFQLIPLTSMLVIMYLNISRQSARRAMSLASPSHYLLESTQSCLISMVIILLLYQLSSRHLYGLSTSPLHGFATLFAFFATFGAAADSFTILSELSRLIGYI